MDGDKPNNSDETTCEWQPLRRRRRHSDWQSQSIHVYTAVAQMRYTSENGYNRRHVTTGYRVGRTKKPLSRYLQRDPHYVPSFCRFCAPIYVHILLFIHDTDAHSLVYQSGNLDARALRRRKQPITTYTIIHSFYLFRGGRGYFTHIDILSRKPYPVTTFRGIEMCGNGTGRVDSSKVSMFNNVPIKYAKVNGNEFIFVKYFYNIIDCHKHIVYITVFVCINFADT